MPANKGGLRPANKDSSIRLRSWWRTFESLRQSDVVSIILPKTNIAPKDGWLEYYFRIAEAYFQGLC